ncbi:MAG: hypothetical protein LUQ38_11775, partial [Methanotrichaceae archaeon]|nr:hypothetical protein [Methanotrichaceae archaeon]
MLLLKYPTYNAAYIGERCKDSTMLMVSLSSMDMITSLEVIMILTWSKESYHANQHEKSCHVFYSKGALNDKDLIILTAFNPFCMGLSINQMDGRDLIDPPKKVGC